MTQTTSTISGQEKIAAAFASFLFFVPLLMNMKTPFVVKYMKQGFIINVVELILAILASIINMPNSLIQLANLAFLVTSISLAIKAYNGKDYVIAVLYENADKLIQTLGISNIFTPGK